MTQLSEIASKIIEAASTDFVSTSSLAAGLKISREQVVDAYDVIEAAGYKLMRIGGIGGGVMVVDAPRARPEQIIASRLARMAREDAEHVPVAVIANSIARAVSTARLDLKAVPRPARAGIAA